MINYSNRQWLNPTGHPSTGSVVAYHGESPWDRDGKPDVLTILEISDCHSKVRLHRSEKDTLEEFIGKLETLRDVIDDFVSHLRSTNQVEVTNDKQAEIQSKQLAGYESPQSALRY